VDKRFLLYNAIVVCTGPDLPSARHRLERLGQQQWTLLSSEVFLAANFFHLLSSTSLGGLPSVNSMQIHVHQ